MRAGHTRPGGPADGRFGTTRVEALARRIFAVSMTLRTAVLATIPMLSVAAVFYNARLALYLCFLLLVVHFLPGRVDEPVEPDPERGC